MPVSRRRFFQGVAVAGVAAGLDVTFPPTDMPWNAREMHVRHPDGHVFRGAKGIEDE